MELHLSYPWNELWKRHFCFNKNSFHYRRIFLFMFVCFTVFISSYDYTFHQPQMYWAILVLLVYRVYVTKTVGTGVAGGRPPPPASDFDQSVNPISTRRGRLQYITISPTWFSDVPTALMSFWILHHPLTAVVSILVRARNAMFSPPVYAII